MSDWGLGGAWDDPTGGGGGGGSYPLAFGGGMGPGPTQFAIANGIASTGPAALDGSPITDHTLPTGGNLVALAVNTSSADDDTVIRVLLDGASFAAGVITLTAPGPAVFTFATPEPVVAGQVVSVQYFEGAAPGRSTFSVLVEV